MDTIHITLNQRRLVLDRREISASELRRLAGLDADHQLFLDRPNDDLLLRDDDTLHLSNGDRLYSQIPAVYGSPQIPIQINGKLIHLAAAAQTGRSLKTIAGIPITDALFLEHHPEDDAVIANDTAIEVHPGMHFHSQVSASYGAHGHDTVVIHIDGTVYHLEPQQTGASLKELAHIALGDTLFLDRPHEDEVVRNDQPIVLSNGMHFHSQVRADYGLATLPVELRLPMAFSEHPQADGWLFIVLSDVPLPIEYRPDRVRILIKLPPSFPDGAPDMFWVSPSVLLAHGGAPRGTTPESALGETWQRFSWHLMPGAWRPGISDLRTFVRCIRARFERRD